MRYKTVRKTVTPQELEAKGETAGDFLLDLRDKLYRYISNKRLEAAISSIKLPNGTKLSLTDRNVEIKLPKNKKIRKDIIEEILIEGTRLLSEENRRRSFGKDRIKITMSLGDNTVYFTQGHLGRSSDGKVIPMDPILDRADDTFVRVLDSNFTSDMSDLGSLIRQQHNRILGRKEEDRTQDIADKLGFTTVEKDDSIIDVQINGVIDSCTVTRLCIHSNEFQDEKGLLENIIGTYRKILELEENPLVIVGLNGSIDITIGRDMNVVTIEHQYSADSDVIYKLIKTVIGLVVTKEALENAKIEYKERIFVEGESIAHKIEEGLFTLIDVIDEVRKKYGDKITLGISLVTISLMFLFFLYNRINPTNSIFQAAMVVIPATIFAVAITVIYRKLSWVATFSQKKLPVLVWLWSGVSYIIIHDAGFEKYLEVLFYIVFAVLGLLAAIKGPSILSPPIMWIYTHILKWIYTHTVKWAYVHILKQIYTYIVRLFSPIIRMLAPIGNKVKIKIEKPSISKGGIIDKMLNGRTAQNVRKLFTVILRVVTTILGTIAVIIFALAFIPLMVLFVGINLLTKGYWRDLETYREDLIEKAIHKYRDHRNLAPSCRVIFKTTKCKRLKNPLSGSWNVLRKKVPRLLTTEGFVDAIDTLVLKGWI